MELIEEETSTNAAGEMTSTWWLVKKRTVQPGLSNVYLHVMYQKAKLPLDKIEDFIDKQPHRFAIPPKLQSLFQTDLITPRDDQTLRQRYIHRSDKDWEDAEFGEWAAHRKESSGKREIFYNRPDRAMVPKRTRQARERKAQ